MGELMSTLAALVCGAALFYVVVSRTARKRHQDALDAEAVKAMRMARKRAA